MAPIDRLGRSRREAIDAFDHALADLHDPAGGPGPAVATASAVVAVASALLYIGDVLKAQFHD